MVTECRECKGIGFFVIEERECPECKGSGKTKSIALDRLSEKDLSSLMQGDMKCNRCRGSGKISVTQPCKTCAGMGRFSTCIVCGKLISENKELCDSCAKKPHVYVLGPECDLQELEVGKVYQGVVQGHANFGVFVDLNPQLRGLIHSSSINFRPNIGDKLLVEIKHIVVR